MMGSKSYVLDELAKLFVVLSDAPSYWFSLNTSYDHAFHLSKRLGMGPHDYEALLIAVDLACYKDGVFTILWDKWKSFITSHERFTILPSNKTLELARKLMKLDTDTEARVHFYILQIGESTVKSTLNFQAQHKQGIFPTWLCNLGIEQQVFRRATELAIAHVHVDLIDKDEEEDEEEEDEEEPMKATLVSSTASTTISPEQQRAGIAVERHQTPEEARELSFDDDSINNKPSIAQQMYPTLWGLYGNSFDPYDPQTQKSMRLVLSEIMHILDASREGLRVKDIAGHEDSFIRVPRASSDKSFRNTKSWLDEAL